MLPDFRLNDKGGLLYDEIRYRCIALAIAGENSYSLCYS